MKLPTKNEILDAITIALKELNIKTIVDIGVNYSSFARTKTITLDFSCGFKYSLVIPCSSKAVIPDVRKKDDTIINFIDENNITVDQFVKFENNIRNILGHINEEKLINFYSSISLTDKSQTITEVIRHVAPMLKELNILHPVFFSLDKARNYFVIELSFNHQVGIQFSKNPLSFGSNEDALNQYLMFNNLKRVDFENMYLKMKKLLSDLDTYGCTRQISEDLYLINSDCDINQYDPLRPEELDYLIEDMENF